MSEAWSSSNRLVCVPNPAKSLAASFGATTNQHAAAASNAVKMLPHKPGRAPLRFVSMLSGALPDRPASDKGPRQRGQNDHHRNIRLTVCSGNQSHSHYWRGTLAVSQNERPVGKPIHYRDTTAQTGAAFPKSVPKSPFPKLPNPDGKAGSCFGAGWALYGQEL